MTPLTSAQTESSAALTDVAPDTPVTGVGLVTPAPQHRSEPSVSIICA